jgi:hypothetical protein
VENYTLFVHLAPLAPKILQFVVFQDGRQPPSWI